MSSAEVSVTHEIKIGRESAWVKVGVNMDHEHGSLEMTIDRAAELVNRKIIEVIEQTVATVDAYEERS